MSGHDLDCPQSTWRGGLCERTGPSLNGAARLSRRIFSKRKTHWGQFGEFHCSSSSSLLSTWLPGAPAGMWGIPSPNPKHLGENAHLRPQAPESTNQGRPTKHTHSPEEGECLNLWVQGHWRAGLGCLCWLQPKMTSKTGLASRLVCFCL